ncbi:MAG: L-threonylcarbamoyladenylate synthase [Nitrospinaceae bacterium]
MPNVLALDFNDSRPARGRMETVRRTLTQGGVIAFPTETFYGLGVNPFNREAVRRLFSIKQRPAGKPILVLVHSRDQLQELVSEISPAARVLMDAFWPGPLTLLFSARETVFPELTGATGKIGLRHPGSEFTRRLISEVGHPLTAPSANLAGQASPRTAAEVMQSLGDAVDLILQGGQPAGGPPSTVLDPTVTPPRMIREGAVSRTALQRVLGPAWA